MERIKKFFKKIFGLDIEPTEQEQRIRDIVTGLLDRDDTNKVLYNSSLGYLSNVALGIQVAIDFNEVVVRSPEGIINIRCGSRFMVNLASLISRSVENRVGGLFKDMSNYQKDALDTICETLA